jgi:hypothetical protein
MKEGVVQLQCSLSNSVNFEYLLFWKEEFKFELLTIVEC